jgi:phosphocarrier protein HPr
MEIITVTITNPIGLHARPAVSLVRLLQDFQCDIKVYKNGDETKMYHPKSILSVMSISAMQGDELTFLADGADEKEAIRAVEEFAKSGCGD